MRVNLRAARALGRHQSPVNNVMLPAECRTQPAAGRPTPSQSFLAALARDEQPIDGSRVCIVVAHPDDETIGCGAQLARLRRATLVMLTDGSPADGIDASRSGDSPENYAQRRRRELNAALDAGLADIDVLWFGVGDQTAAYRMIELATRLAQELRSRRSSLLLTHAYEGGHPDHDAAACIVQLAAAQLHRTDPGSPPGIIEMPYYRACAGDMARQTFLMEMEGETADIHLSAVAVDRKARMVASYVSQASMLREFDMTRERFRITPEYDFTQLPNGGDLLYERFGWGSMSGARWIQLVREARRAARA